MTVKLCIDTASARFAIGIAEGGTEANIYVDEGERNHSQRLLAAIEELVGPRKNELTEIVVVTGPGSYAGLRAGIATAQGLGLALDVPVRGVPTMTAIAEVAARGDSFVAIHPAGRGAFAAQRFEAGGAVGELYSATAEELAGLALAGEGVGDFGGEEIDPGDRCRAALTIAQRSTMPDDGVEAIYLREPHITLPRKRVDEPTPGAR